MRSTVTGAQGRANCIVQVPFNRVSVLPVAKKRAGSAHRDRQLHLARAAPLVDPSLVENLSSQLGGAPPEVLVAGGGAIGARTRALRPCPVFLMVC